MKELYLTEPQERFVFSEAIHPGMVAGYGAGKSQAGVIRIALKALQYPRLSFGFVEPTFDLVRLIAWPRFSEILESWGVDHELNKSESIMRIENDAQIVFRSADNPDRLVGFEVADSLIDEADVLKHADAENVWIKMLGRTRQKKPDGKPNSVAAVSTPEGFKWMYHRFGKDPQPGYELIRAPTMSNPYLPSGYVETLRGTYPSNLLSAYLDGEFVNLTAGSVYPQFSRHENASTEVVKPEDVLHIGMDFNVTKGAAVVHVLRNGEPHAVDEFTDVFDTPAMIGLIKSRYPEHRVFIYPDASGKSRKSQNASVSDIALLQQARFTVCANHANPMVKDRVLSMNKMIDSRRYRVNVDKAPALVEGLEQQAYDKNGEPDKSAGMDHVLDAAGYFVSYKFPVAHRTATVMALHA